MPDHSRCLRRSTLYGGSAACGADCPVVYNINYGRGARAGAKGGALPAMPEDRHLRTAVRGWQDGWSATSGRPAPVRGDDPPPSRREQEARSQAAQDFVRTYALKYPGIWQMRREGMAGAEIARHFGITRQAVYWIFKRRDSL